MTIGFHDTRLPVYIEQNAEGGPLFSTSVVTTASGAEVRNQNWQYSKQTYDITYGITELGQTDGQTYDVIDAFFRARRGQLYGFRFKDWLDFQATAQPIGTGDGQNKTFQLSKLYADAILPYTRKITRPVVGTINVYVGGTLLSGGWELGNLGALNIDVAPGGGVPVTADFQFDVPVRFADDQLDLTALRQGAAQVNAIKLIEVMEE